MMSSPSLSMQRTLILTAGPLAQEAGALLTHYLQERPSPAAAIAIVHEASGAATTNGVDWETAVRNALIRISPPDLAAHMARAGWRLAEPPEIALILLLDATPEAHLVAQTLLTRGSALVYECLGVETTTLLIWLAAEINPQTLSACLMAELSLSRPMLALSLRNEAGLRLPTPTTLAQAAADLLWLLTATPLRDLPESAAAMQGEAYTGETLICSVGLHAWRWSPTATRTSFMNHWLQEVFAYWLARAPDAADPAQVASWLEGNELSATGFAAHALLPAEQALPDFLAADWRAPWPGHIQRLLTTMKFNEAADETLQADLVLQAELRMDEPLQHGMRLLRAQAQSMLDAQPIAGVARTCAWLQEAADACRLLYEQMLDQQEAQAVSGDLLATERGRLNARFQRLLEEWPSPTWRAWLRIALRPWRWPTYGWRYWQLRQTGQQMSQVMVQQAARRRQEVVQRAVRQALSELERIAWRIHGQVEEVGDMLNNLAAEVEQGLSHPIPSTALQEEEETGLPIPWLLYKRLAPDPAAEAETAAAAIGGLGRQLQALDDALWPPLAQAGARRLAADASFTTVDALLANLQEAPLLEVWRNGWEAAAPLWRYDETRLTETARAYHRQQTFICGAGALMLADLLGESVNEATWLQSADRERLFVVRARVGLTPAALIADWQSPAEAEMFPISAATTMNENF